MSVLRRLTFLRQVTHTHKETSSFQVGWSDRGESLSAQGNASHSNDLLTSQGGQPQEELGERRSEQKTAEAKFLRLDFPGVPAGRGCQGGEPCAMQWGCPKQLLST